MWIFFPKGFNCPDAGSSCSWGVPCFRWRNTCNRARGCGSRIIRNDAWSIHNVDFLLVDIRSACPLTVTGTANVQGTGMAGNAQPRTRMENNGLTASCSLSEDSKRNKGLENCDDFCFLLDTIRNGGDLIRLGGGGPAGGNASALKIYFGRDRQSGFGGA